MEEDYQFIESTGTGTVVSINPLKTFYISAPWLGNKIVECFGLSRLDAVAGSNVTVFDGDSFEDLKKLPNIEFVDIQGKPLEIEVNGIDFL